MEHIMEHFGIGFLEVTGFTAVITLLFSFLGKGGMVAAAVSHFLNGICG